MSAKLDCPDRDDLKTVACVINNEKKMQIRRKGMTMTSRCHTVSLRKHGWRRWRGKKWQTYYAQSFVYLPFFFI